jgi:hypothetical protein
VFYGTLFVLVLALANDCARKPVRVEVFLLPSSIKPKWITNRRIRVRLAILAIGTRNSEAAHEFTHILGVDDRYSGKYVSHQKGAERAMSATGWDYAWAFGGEIQSHRDASRPNRPVPLAILNRAPAANGRAGPRSYRSTREVGAPTNWGFGKDGWK